MRWCLVVRHIPLSILAPFYCPWSPLLAVPVALELGTCTLSVCTAPGCRATSRSCRKRLKLPEWPAGQATWTGSVSRPWALPGRLQPSCWRSRRWHPCPACPSRSALGEGGAKGRFPPSLGLSRRPPHCPTAATLPQQLQVLAAGSKWRFPRPAGISIIPSTPPTTRSSCLPPRRMRTWGIYLPWEGDLAGGCSQPGGQFLKRGALGAEDCWQAWENQ